jgi:hypothetical protein
MFIFVVQTLQNKWNEICMKQLASGKHLGNNCFPRTLKFEMMLSDAEVGATEVVLAINPSSSRLIKIVQDNDSISKAIRLGDLGSNSERMGAASALKTSNIILPRSKLESQIVWSTYNSSSNLVELQ